MDIKALFEKRDRTYLNLLKASVYLGRVIRENVALFDVDSSKDTAFFLTESERIVKARFDIDLDKVILEEIEILDPSELTSEENFNDKIKTEIKTLVGSTREGSFTRMNETFDSILGSFSARIKLHEVNSKLQAKSTLVQLDQVNKEPFLKLCEIKDLVVSFVAENLDKINENKEFLYNLRAANAITKSLDVTNHLSIEELEGTSQVFIKEELDSPLFDLICAQEFLKRELYESKTSLYSSWLDSDLVNELLTHVVEDSDCTNILEKVVTEYPYFAFLNKKDFLELVESYFSVNGEGTVSKKKLNTFAKKIFEDKKPYKEALVHMLNEKYGISLSQIKETPSLKSLGKLQYDILAELYNYTGEIGVLADVLLECSRSVRGKGGIDLLWVNDAIMGLFEENNIIAENTKYLNLDAIKQDLLRIKNVLAGQYTGGEGGEVAPEDGMPPEEEAVPEEEVMPGEEAGVPGEDVDFEGGEEDVPDEDAFPEEGQGEGQEGPIPPDEERPLPGEEGPLPGEEGMAPEEEGMAPEEEGMQGEVGVEAGAAEGGTTPEELMGVVKDIEAMLQGANMDADVAAPQDDDGVRDVYDE